MIEVFECQRVEGYGELLHSRIKTYPSWAKYCEMIQRQEVSVPKSGEVEDFRFVDSSTIEVIFTHAKYDKPIIHWARIFYDPLLKPPLGRMKRNGRKEFSSN